MIRNGITVIIGGLPDGNFPNKIKILFVTNSNFEVGEYSNILNVNAK
jgi:hypothetical protein